MEVTEIFKLFYSGYSYNYIDNYNIFVEVTLELIVRTSMKLRSYLSLLTMNLHYSSLKIILRVKAALNRNAGKK